MVAMRTSTEIDVSAGCAGFRFGAGTLALLLGIALVFTPGAAAAGAPYTTETASISGTVTLPTGVDCPDPDNPCVWAYLYHANGDLEFGVQAKADGSYQFRQLPEGKYKIQFSADQVNAVDLWWPESDTFMGATEINLKAGDVRTGVDAWLFEGATVRGTFTVPAIDGGSDGTLAVRLIDTLTLEPIYVQEIPLDSGHFAITGVQPGEYKLDFVSYFGAPVLHQWYPGTGDLLDAVTLRTASGETKDLDQVVLKSGGSISGYISLAGGRSPKGLRAVVYNSLGEEIDSDSVPANGRYMIESLPADTYRVRVENSSDINVLDTWFGGTTGFGDAGLVIVEEGQDTARVDVRMLTGGSVSGKVKLPSGTKVGDGSLHVAAYGPRQEYLGSTSVRSNLTYELVGLPTGPTRLQVLSYAVAAAGQWYKGKSTFEAATPISVMRRSMAKADFVLGSSGSVKGVVTPAGGVQGSVSALQVCLYSADNAASPDRQCSEVKSDGTYLIKDLQPGDYRLLFESQYGEDSGFASQWFAGQASHQNANNVRISAGTTATANVTMKKGSSISGTVTVPDGMDLLGGNGVLVQVVDVRGDVVGEASVDVEGRFRVGGLPGGSYTVRAVTEPYWCGTFGFQSSPANAALLNLSPAWYGGGSGLPVNLGGGSAAAGIDISMVQGAAVSGIVGMAPGSEPTLDTAVVVRAYDAADPAKIVSEWPVRIGRSFQWPGLPAGVPLKFEFAVEDSPADVPWAPASQWFSGARTFEDADSVVLTANTVTPNLSATLELVAAPPEVRSPLVSRIAGGSRYLTNLAVNEEVMAAGKPVFVATGSSFADALSAAPAVRAMEGSLVLTGKDRTDPELLWLIASKRPSEIFIIGGRSAVSDKVASTLTEWTEVPTERVAGSTRYETSQKILTRFFEERAIDGAFVATGTAFPDALSASAAGGALDMPVVLVNGAKDKELPQTVSDLLRDKTTNIQLVGGSGAVSEVLATSLREDGFAVGRLSGANRFATNVEINRYIAVQRPESEVTGIWAATGTNFPDALSASVPAGDASQRLVLSRKSCIPTPAVTDWFTQPASVAPTVTLVGGAGALANTVFDLTECK